jgi:hypothetical protein
LTVLYLFSEYIPLDNKDFLSDNFSGGQCNTLEGHDAGRMISRRFIDETRKEVGGREHFTARESLFLQCFHKYFY